MYKDYRIAARVIAVTNEDRDLQRQRRQWPAARPVALARARLEPDVVCLQELKAPQDKFPEAAIRDAGYGAIWHGQKSWNGVAILARGAKPIETRRGLPGDPDDMHSRYIEAAVDGVLVGCLYLPNGNPAPGPKFDYKLRWFERLTALRRGHCSSSTCPSCWPAITTSCPPSWTSTSRSAGSTTPCSARKSAPPFTR